MQIVCPVACAGVLIACILMLVPVHDVRHPNINRPTGEVCGQLFAGQRSVDFQVGALLMCPTERFGLCL